MITAKEALAKTTKYHNCQDKMAYYEHHIDEEIITAADKGKRQIILNINENEFTDIVVNHVVNILLEKEFIVQIGSRGYSSILMISW
jgi:hypothetical protein